MPRGCLSLSCYMSLRLRGGRGPEEQGRPSRTFTIARLPSTAGSIADKSADGKESSSTTEEDSSGLVRQRKDILEHETKESFWAVSGANEPKTRRAGNHGTHLSVHDKQ